MRHLNFRDKLITLIDQGLRVSLGGSDAIHRTHRPSPARANPTLNSTETRQSQRLMRVNHAGEVAAQALYYGQALVATTPEVSDFLLQAAAEEGDHLHWCAERLEQLGTRPSALTPFWFMGSAAIGVMAGLRSDAVSLGFIDETERQVEGHINAHLERLPAADTASRDILEQMKWDEASHAAHARERGAHALTPFTQRLMQRVSKVMTATAARI
jgi:3-demethoxyubiquinol 3-hydroxylase